MKRWIALLLTIALSVTLVGCEAGNVTPEDIRDTAALLEEVANQMEEGGYDLSQYSFPELDLDSLDVNELADLGIDFSNLSPEELASLGIDLNDFSPEQLEAAGLNLLEMTEAELKAYGIDLSRFNLEDYIPSGIDLGDITSIFPKEDTTEGTSSVADASEESNVIDFLPDHKTDLKENIYGYVNYDLLKGKSLPEGYSYWSSFTDLALNAQSILSEVTLEAAKNLKTADQESAQYRVGALYETGLDMDARNALGVEPVMAYVNAFLEAENLDELYEADAMCYEQTGFEVLFAAGFDDNPVNSQEYALYVNALRPVESREVMLEDKLSSRRDAYLVYIGRLYQALGLDEMEAALRAASAFTYEEEYAEYRLTQSERSNPEKTVNLFTREELIQNYSNLPLERFFKDRGYTDDTYQCNVMDTKAFGHANELWTEESLEEIKNHAVLVLMNYVKTYLNEEVYRATRDYYMAANGIDTDRSFEDVLNDTVNSTLPVEMGQLYIEKSGLKDSKKDIEEMIAQIQETYKEMIADAEWMSEDTKAQAIEKVDQMVVHAVYPDTWNNMVADAKIKSVSDGGSYFENIVEIKRAEAKSNLEQIKKKRDRTQWSDSIYPQTVNAFYSPTENAIYILAGILQSPFYSPTADEGTNLGGIGYVIGHEISHAFDSSGAKYNTIGEYKEWWSEEDVKKYDELAQKVVDYYNHCEILPDVRQNGSLTLTENLADLSALKCIERMCDQDTELYRGVCLSAVRCWATKMTESRMNYLLTTDVHAIGSLRSYVPLQMTDLFYKTFDIKEGDGMFVPKKDRVGIW